MYNRYVPQTASYTWVGADRGEENGRDRSRPVGRPAEREGGRKSGYARTPDRGEERSCITTIRSALQTLWKSNAFDSGDLLLLLILLLLLKEGEDPELIIVLGAVLLFGAGEKRDETEEQETGDG